LKLTSKIEAILYLKGEPVTLSQIVLYAGCQRVEASEAILELMSEYGHRESALEIVETNIGYSLQLRPSFAPLIQSLLPAELSSSLLRTLAAIALKQPLLQSELIILRGNSAYEHVKDLIEQGFVKKRPSGRSFELLITEKFHQYFEIDQLPNL
jgi:segregation and condensation protein B